MEWTKLFRGFFDSERIGGLLLLFCTILSLILANSGWGEPYTHFWHQKADLSFAGLHLDLSVEQWINDGLMTIFFLLVGLEIERELYAGELSSFSNAILPIAAAVGGMVVPAAIHFAFNNGTPTQSGFGIPMATDIAFTLGMLALAGNRVPYSLKIFLTALAIIDDLGAILVIALFYNTGIQWLYLALSAAILGGLFFLSKLKIYHLAFYLLPGLVLWYCMMQSGVHPTIAGVLLAFVIPFSGNNENTPSYKLQQFLHKPVAFFIVPMFALANTGIVLKQGWITEIGTSNSLGIITGLVVGKPVGILLFCYLLITFFKTKLPQFARWSHLTGAAILAGIGFTMSIFISNLAFTDADLVSYSKVAVLLGSLLATIIGLTLLRNTAKPDHLDE
ncbi:Na+/H+ antiporter NhaA [Flavisolibacter nicotianae]|uniref:Na+/H+ antiporter NhaA n=1 Tax=Flavisolibacter nicotianae TaxID=2364882 RepID=UPI000EB29134|nr:Na+/H+ antiporter NhaA [Flavisolibacter nicotianae]